MSERRDPPKPPAPPRAKPTTDAFGQLPRLPLGAEAFVSPLHAPPPVEESSKPPRRRSLGLLTAVSLLSGGIALGAWFMSARPEVPFAQQDHGSLRVMPGARLREKPVADHALEKVKAAAISMNLPSLLGKEEAKPAASGNDDATTGSTKPKAAARAEEHATGRGSRARRAKPETTAKLAEVPERSAVIAAMKRITPAVERCFGDVHGVAKVTFFVRGQTGKVTLARVSGLAGKPGSCIATVVRRVSLPPFQRTQLEISYPFSH